MNNILSTGPNLTGGVIDDGLNVQTHTCQISKRSLRNHVQSLNEYQSLTSACIAASEPTKIIDR